MRPSAEPDPRTQQISLPYGLWRSRSVSRRLLIRAIAGFDEMAVHQTLADGAPAAWAGNVLIGRCAADLDAPETPLGYEAAAALTLGDREVVLRALYALTFSPRIAASAPCTADCGEVIAFDLNIAALAEEPPEPGPTHRLRIEGHDVTLRLPTGGDLARAVSVPTDPADALIAACVEDGSATREAIARALARLDPNAECAVVLECPGCGRTLSLLLDGFELIRRALLAGGGILEQVHRLASAYGWSEGEILALPRSRRQRYCLMAEAAA